ncbi:methyltransferase domain-containing protein [Alkalicoccus luteus]|uniref:methyltransferase domain-containing protein n=1 Tax=Alkalicoccus luteus TaxID=1237094 RepID=UPI0040344D77
MNGTDLENIVFIGRTMEEYKAFFQLEERDLQGKRILDCPAGACSFTAEAAADVTAVDLAYRFPAGVLYEKGSQDIDRAAALIQGASNQYVWNYIKDASQLKQRRERALRLFTEDYERRAERYVQARLPELPFEDDAFDLVLSAHFLFTYADRLDYCFHEQAVREMLRVTSSELRMFPLLDYKGRRSRYVDDVKQFAEREGWLAEEIPVSYEFQKGANVLLRIRKREDTC